MILGLTTFAFTACGSATDGDSGTDPSAQLTTDPTVPSSSDPTGGSPTTPNNMPPTTTVPVGPDPTDVGPTPTLPDNGPSAGGASGGSGPVNPGPEGGAPSGGSGNAGGAGTAGQGTGGTSAGAGGEATGEAGAGEGGANTGGEGNAGAGTAGTASGGSGNESGEPRSMGYVGCSMSVNVTQGYQTLGGMRLWPPIQTYNGKVVQNWTNNSDSAWQAFEQQASMSGTPDTVWVMLCIFNNMVSYDETKQIIANVRQRAPNATIYITGQPLYADGLTCDLAGNGGPELTDSMAQMAADDETQNVIYGGTFGPLTSPQLSDSCHANGEGQEVLGQQAIEKWGE